MSARTLTDTEVAARLRLAIGRLNRRLRQQASGMTLSQLSALVTIETHQPIRLSDLAAREGVAAPTATRVVSALEDARLITRRSSPDDRRATLLSLTARGRQTLDRLRQQATARLSEGLQQCAEDELAALTAALPVLERLAHLDSGG